MTLLINLAVAILIAIVFRAALRKVPAVLYILAALFDLLVLYGTHFSLPPVVWEMLIAFQTRGLLAFSLFFIVMFIGVLGKESRLRAWVGPIRAELAITASILAIGHVANYAGIYIARLFLPSATTVSMLLAFAVAAVLIILLVPLAISSIKAVKKRMDSRHWVKLQRLSYVFFALVYVHIALILFQPVMAGGQKAIISLALYTALFALYAIARIRRAILDSKTPEQDPTQPTSA